MADSEEVRGFDRTPLPALMSYENEMTETKLFIFMGYLGKMRKKSAKRTPTPYVHESPFNKQNRLPDGRKDGRTLLQYIRLFFNNTSYSQTLWCIYYANICQNANLAFLHL